MTTETTRHTSNGMHTRLVATAADVISRAMQQGRTLPAALAVALDSACLLQSPDTAAEHRAAALLEVAEVIAGIDFHPNARARSLDIATGLVQRLRRMADEPHPGKYTLVTSWEYELMQRQQERAAAAEARVAQLEADREANDREYEAATARIAELEARLAEYERPADEDPIAYALTEQAATAYPATLPWARLMDADDLEEFLADLTAAIVGRDGTAALDEVEKTCGTWRLIAEAQHAHNTAPGPDADEGLSGPCDCGEGAVHYTAADCPAVRRAAAETGGAS
ncbi:hypothetical protein IMX12_13145 [Streptomyces sp. Babs14]|uniref:hypothetical protein n=1 Tax=unclassified Streptomyces TaxID=2593676 RepID=UPI001C220AC7|nr:MULTISPECIES: hypothetical protein [unclassified Streptomyces]MBU8549755.1 hypothetical protein [Streptomyces sp. Osf17]MBU8556538.1 hypothetical protein [Streptomyces sp. Babs14]